jgi:hypothetical protein
MKCNALMTQLIFFFNIIKNHRQEVKQNGKNNSMNRSLFMISYLYKDTSIKENNEQSAGKKT